MTLNLSMPGHDELKPRITVFGVGGAGGGGAGGLGAGRTVAAGGTQSTIIRAISTS